MVRIALPLHPCADDAELVASELFTNALLHGGAGEIEVTVTVAPDRVRIACVDGGGRSPRLVQADEADEHHRGLALVSLIAVAYGHTSTPGHTEVWAELAAKPDP